MYYLINIFEFCPVSASRSPLYRYLYITVKQNKPFTLTIRGENTKPGHPPR